MQEPDDTAKLLHTKSTEQVTLSVSPLASGPRIQQQLQQALRVVCVQPVPCVWQVMQLHAPVCLAHHLLQLADRLLAPPAPKDSLLVVTGACETCSADSACCPLSLALGSPQATGSVSTLSAHTCQTALRALCARTRQLGACPAASSTLLAGRTCTRAPQHLLWCVSLQRQLTCTGPWPQAG